MKSKTPLIFLILVIPCFLFAQNSPKIDAQLAEAFAENPNSYHTAYLILEDQVDLKSMNTDFKNRNVPIAEKQRVTLKALTEKAAQTQSNLIDKLKGVDGVNISSITSLWLVNAIKIEATPAAYQEIQAFENIDFITKPMETTSYDVDVEESTNYTSTAPVPNGHEPGLDLINAPALWAMGYSGYGKTIAVMDTGTDDTHPALMSNNKYHNSPLNEAWFGVFEEPYLCGAHGTHVGGTVVGLDRIQNDTVGVAYNAKFMHTAIFIECDNRMTDNLQAFQWVLNPDGNTSTVDDIPDAINFSGGLPPPVSIAQCNDIIVQNLIQAFIAVNMAVFFAAGNSGNQPETIGYPAALNEDIIHLFSVGNLNADNMVINPFSSIGPSACVSSDSSIYIKPEVCAPGTLVRSCVLNGGYQQYTGTSMAAPHTAGAYLLLKEAYPFLTEEDILRALYFSAIDLGPVGEDNTYGMGLIDVLAAYHYLQDLGHVPVPPISADNDVIAISARFNSPALCEGQTSMEVTFENSGVNPLTTLDITITENNNQFAEQTMTWTGNLENDEIATMVVPFSVETTGAYEVIVQLQNPNGLTDERNLNNVFKTTFNYYEETVIPANISSQYSSPVCENAAVILTADGSLAENQNYVWFGTDDEMPLGIGSTFVTPPLASSANFSVDIYSNHNVGKEVAASNSLIGDADDTGLVFDVTVPIIINSVKIFAEETGGRLLKLENSAGNTLESKIVSVQSIGEQRIDLNMIVPPGNGYVLYLDAGNGLAYDNATFPYEVDQVVSIISSMTETGLNDNIYNYFYDWEISAQHPCGRTEITIDVAGELASLVDFSVEEETIILEEATDILFSDLSENASSWNWDFGNGETSTLQNPTTSFTEVGTYPIVLTVTDMNGCVNSMQQEIEVIEDNLSPTTNIELETALIVYPNPTEGQLYVQLPENISKNAAGNLIVYDVIGNQMKRFSVASNSELVEIQIDDLIAGVYLLLYQSNQMHCRPTFFVKH